MTVQSWMRLSVLTVMVGILSCSRNAGEFVLVNHAPEAIQNVSVSICEQTFEFANVFRPGSWRLTRLQQKLHINKGHVVLLARLVPEA